MREYNNQDVKSNEAELDPCIAAEIRMKKAIFSPRTRRNLLVLLAVTAVVILLSVLLIFLLSGPSKKTNSTEPRETRPEDFHVFENVALASTLPLTITTRTTYMPPEMVVEGSTRSEEVIQPKAVEVYEDDFHEEPDDGFSLLEKDVTDAPETTTELDTGVPLEADPEYDTESTTGAATLTVTTLMTSTILKTTKLVTTTTIAPTSPVTTATTIVVPENVTGAVKNDGSTTTLPSFVNDGDEDAKDCKSLLAKGKSESGIYQITMLEVGKVDVLCDMTTDGGGWTVIQKRIDGTIYFANRTWKEYDEGFGQLTSSFWLGLSKIYGLVQNEGGKLLTLRIEIRGDLCEDKTGCSKIPDGYWWGEWDFKIGDAAQKYTLSLSSAIAGNLSDRSATDKFQYMNNGKPFTTVDQDNDRFQGNCAQFRDFGGWWHNDCGYVALNGKYGDRSSKMRNTFWFYGSGTRPFVTYYIKPQQTEMKLRPKNKQ